MAPKTKKSDEMNMNAPDDKNEKSA